MSAPGSPPPPNGSRPSGVVGQVLAAILNVSDWKRATLLIVLGASALVGLIVYQARDRLLTTATDFFQTPARPTLSVTMAQEIAVELLELPGVTMVSVWAVDVERNLRSLIAFAADPERTALLTARTGFLDRLRRGYPLLRYQAGVNAPFIHVLNGELACAPPHPTLEEAPFYDATALAFYCLQGVPPEPGVLNGMISLGFARELTPGEIEALTPQLFDAADRLTERAGKGKPKS